MKPRRLVCCASIAVFIAVATTATHADVFTWDPNNDVGATAASGAWDLTTANWLGAPSRLWPNDPGSGADVALFGGSGAGFFAVTLGSPIVANGLTFNTDGYMLSNVGIVANTLTLDGPQPTLTVTTVGHTATVSAVVSGTDGLTKAGAGTLLLTEANTYGGITNVTNGILGFGLAGNLGSGTAGNSIAISNNATLRFTGATPEMLGTTRSLAIGGGGATIEHAGTGLLTLNGVITSTAGNAFTKKGNGTLMLTGNSPGFVGNVVVDGGTLQVGNVALTQFPNAIGVSSPTRTITVNTGAILDFQGRDATGNTPPAFVINGGTVRNTSGFTRMGNLTLNGGTIHVIQGNSAGYQAMTFNGDVTVTGATPSVITTTGGTFNGIHLEKAGGVIFDVPDITGTAAPDLSIATPLFNITNTLPANGFIKNGAGTLLLSGANAFSGTLTINEGTVSVSTANTANPPLTFGVLPAATPVLTTSVAFRVGNVTQSATGAAGLITGVGTLGLTGDRTFTIGDTASITDLLVTIPVGNGDGTARALTKSGTGTVQFDGINTFTGNFNINEGRVVMNASQSAAGNLTMGATAGATPELVINTGVIYRLNANPVFNAVGNGNIISGAGSLGLFADRAFNIFDGPALDDTVISVPISNGDATARSWRKEQTGRLVLRGDNTFTGNLDIYRGTLVFDYSVNNGSKVPDTGGVTALRGGKLILSGNAGAPTTEVVPSFSILAGAGSVELLPINGQALNFALNGITRGTGQGLVNFATADVALGKYLTTTTNNLHGILGPYALFNGNRFATVAAGSLGAVASTVQGDRGEWLSAQNIVVGGTLSGALTTPAIHSLVFDGAVENTLALNNPGRALTVRSGGVAVSSNVGANNTTISGGLLMADFNNNNGTTELVLANYSTGTLFVSAAIGSNNTPLISNGALTLGGTGLIEVSGRNLYLGTTNIQGNVRIAGGNAFSDFTQLNLAAGGDMVAAGGALLNLNGTSEGIGSLSGGVFTSQGAGEIQLGAGGTLTINETAATTYQGLLTGSGTVIKRGGATLTLTVNPQAFTGEWQVLGGLTDFTGNNAGLTGATSIVLRGGSLLSQQDQGANVDKIANGAVIHLEGTTGNGLRMSSNQNGPRVETADRLDLNAGSNVITLTNTVGGPTAAITTLTFANASDAFTRDNNATLLARSGVADFGGTSTTLSNRVTFASGITGDLVGGPVTAATTTIAILPYAIGGVSSVANPGDTFVTVGANGIRPLNIGTEFATDYAAAGATTNLTQNASGSALATKGINSLRIDSSAGNVTLTGDVATTLNLASGALLVSAGANANAAVVGGYDQILAGTADATPDELVIHVTTSNATPANALLTINSPIADNGAAASLTKSGTGTLVLGAANPYTGATTINQGTLQFSAASQLGADGLIRVAGGTLSWAPGNTTDISVKSTSSARTVKLLGPSPFLSPANAGNILTVGNRFEIGANNVTLANPIGDGGNGGLTKSGTGTLSLGASPNYTGPTLVRQGGMDFATIAANTTSALYLVGDTGTVTSTVASDLNLQSLIVGGVFTGTGNSTGTLTVNGGGVNIGDGSGDDFVLIGYRDLAAINGVAGTTRGTVNFQNASSVNINVARMLIGQNLNTSGGNLIDGDLILSNGTNNVTANQIIMGNSAGPGNTGAASASSILLGTGTSIFNVDSFSIGGQKSDAFVTLGAGGSLSLRGVAGGTSSANLFIGDNDAAGTGSISTSAITRLDLSLGIANLKVNMLTIGRHTGGSGGGQGALIFTDGIVEAQTIVLGTSDFRGGTSTADASTVGVITQNGGDMRFQSLSKGVGTATYNWNGGIIGNVAGTDLNNQDVTISLLTASPHPFEVSPGSEAVFQAAAGFSGAGALTKTGAGALILNGPSTFASGTMVEDGLLIANNVTGSALGTGPVVVDLTGTLSGNGSVAGVVTIDSGGTIAPGVNIESLDVGSLTMNGGSSFALEINTSSATSDVLNISTQLFLDAGTSPALSLADLGSNAVLPEGSMLSFISYSAGTWNGGLFSVGGNPISDDVESFAFGANQFRIDYNFADNSVVLISVPEPGTGLILLGGLATALGCRRSRRRA